MLWVQVGEEKSEREGILEEGSSEAGPGGGGRVKGHVQALGGALPRRGRRAGLHKRPWLCARSAGSWVSLRPS